jgi:CubicO group peptidase (beta-lactamase class C family)
VKAEDFPRSKPSEQAVDARGVLSFVDALEALPDVEPHSLMLLRHGSVVAEAWWTPYTPERPHLLYSLSKSFTSTALGLAVA